jgi:uncharacterized membrane-anchored protein
MQSKRYESNGNRIEERVMTEDSMELIINIQRKGRTSRRLNGDFSDWYMHFVQSMKTRIRSKGRIKRRTK